MRPDAQRKLVKFGGQIMAASLPELVVLDMAGTTIDEGQQVYRVLAETAIAH